jgi:hypothetical protein
MARYENAQGNLSLISLIWLDYLFFFFISRRNPEVRLNPNAYGLEGKLKMSLGLVVEKHNRISRDKMIIKTSSKSAVSVSTWPVDKHT